MNNRAEAPKIRRLRVGVRVRLFFVLGRLARKEIDMDGVKDDAR